MSNKVEEFHQYLRENGVNVEAFEQARTIVFENISIPEYFKHFVDRDIDLNLRPVTLCILHDEDTPSFKYFRDSEKFHCFGCMVTGTVLELHFRYRSRDYSSYTIMQALIDLADYFNVKIPDIYEVEDIGKTHRVEGNKEKNKLIKIVKNVNKGSGSSRTFNSTNIAINTIENKLKMIRNNDIEKYISLCNEFDKITVINLSEDEKLNRLNKFYDYNFKGA